MASQIVVSPGEGRLSTLTFDQEQKLKDMWSHFLNYCGALPPELKSTVSNLKQHPSCQEKKKRGFFGFGKGSSENSSGLSEEDIFREAVHDLPGDQVLKVALSMVRCDNPDSLLLRFLRARKWVVKDALKMMGDTFYWRSEVGHPEELLRKGEWGALQEKNDGFILQFEACKGWIYGYDVAGRPLVHVHPDRHDPNAQDIKAVQEFTVFLIESARLCLKDPVDTACVFFDLSKFGISNMDYGAVKFLISCFEGYYPECLGCLVIHKAPWIFSRIWSIIKNWMDPVVASKITFTRTPEELARFIPLQFIEKEHGGTSDFEYKYIRPVPEDSIKTQDKEALDQYQRQFEELSGKFIDATIEWIRSNDKESNERTQKLKNQISDEMIDLYWKYDENLRSRSILDKNGVLDDFKKLHSEWKVVASSSKQES